MKIFLCLVLFSGACWPQRPDTIFSGRVVSVSDGDSVTVLVAQQRRRVRLFGIDAPERGQAFGTKARQFLGSLALHKEVTVSVRDKDQYGRLVAEVSVSGGPSVNQEMVRSGFAWWYVRHNPNDKLMKVAESQARVARRGLWSDPRPVPPWTFRRHH